MQGIISGKGDISESRKFVDLFPAIGYNPNTIQDNQ